MFFKALVVAVLSFLLGVLAGCTSTYTNKHTFESGAELEVDHANHVPAWGKGYQYHGARYKKPGSDEWSGTLHKFNPTVPSAKDDVVDLGSSAVTGAVAATVWPNDETIVNNQSTLEQKQLQGQGQQQHQQQKQKLKKN